MRGAPTDGNERGWLAQKQEVKQETDSEIESELENPSDSESEAGKVKRGQ
jgi:hypothetical protein